MTNDAVWAVVITGKRAVRSGLREERNNDEDEDDEDEAQHRQERRRLLLVLWVEIWHQREKRIRHRNTHCTYLTCSGLNPSPCIGTP